MNTENTVENVETVENASTNPVTSEPETVVHSSVSAVIEGVKTKGKPGRKVIPGSNLQRAKSIYTHMAGAKRSDVVAAFVADKIPKGSANTYYHLIKNEGKSPS